ncbi:nuclear transport factor 2 family protein [Gordonia sp. SL306]|uniref:nuclear transport factor 2 family protein n=1 Tax=Gordonia sp. SL306 TaxID=2995145 RepID=UPI0022707C72|nr:nuclear transport factor 2 family protein [Gordonia sp. SL306]WAC57501.1 nuclear transport factor 2 family protein [Gordonia sp. SL306]
MSNTSEKEKSASVTPTEMEAVRELLHRYARAVDSRDEDLLADCLHPDVVLHRVDGPRHGRDTVLAFYRTVFDGPTTWSKHLVSNITCTSNPDGIDVGAYFHAASTTSDGGLSVFGEYSDRVVRSDDGSLCIVVKAIDVQQIFPMEVSRG